MPFELLIVQLQSGFYAIDSELCIMSRICINNGTDAIIMIYKFGYNITMSSQTLTMYIHSLLLARAATQAICLTNM